MKHSPVTNIQLDAVFAALSHTKRRAILHDLSFRPATVSQLARDHELSLPAIYKHLKLMDASQLIVRRKSGRTNYVALNERVLRSVQHWVMQYHTEWGSGTQTLDNYIAAMQKP